MGVALITETLKLLRESEEAEKKKIKEKIDKKETTK